MIYCNNGTPKLQDYNDEISFDWCPDRYEEPTIFLETFPRTHPGFYWTSSQDKDDKGYAIVINFSGGYSFPYEKPRERYVRLVRNGE